jgi:hypothetical protein
VASVHVRTAIRLLLCAMLSAILFRYWLTTPVLDRMSIGQWRAVGISVAALIGSLCAFSKWNVSTLACGFVVGALAGCFWAAFPMDHRGSIADAFYSSTELSGSDIAIFTATVTLSGCWFARARRRRF